jgi:NAD(P)-dependent dehydrogenase (short-subunit alcohol dehydrogenase family)
MSDAKLTGKTAIVTGGSSGIGKSIVLLFAREGAQVMILDIDAAGADEIAATIPDGGGRVTAYGCDVSDHLGVQKTIDAISAEHRIDILVNNAGIAHVGDLLHTGEADMDRLYRVNVKGVYNCMFAVLAHMQAFSGGVILNMASIAAKVGITERFAYSMSKGAVLTMTLSVARDYVDDNIRCNCICPARVHTPFVDRFVTQNYPGKEVDMYQYLANYQPVGRMATPDEIAGLALYLCSDDAAFITGGAYDIDGGVINLR